MHTAIQVYPYEQVSEIHVHLKSRKKVEEVIIQPSEESWCPELLQIGSVYVIIKDF